MKYDAMARIIFATRWRDVLPMFRNLYALEEKFGVDVKVRLKIRTLLSRMPHMEVVMLGSLNSVRTALCEVRSFDERPETERPPVRTHVRPFPQFPRQER